MNDWSMVLLDLDTCVDLCLYIFSLFFLFSKELFKFLSLKMRKELKKSCFENQLNQENVEQICIKMYSAKAKRLIHQRYIKNIMASLLKNRIVQIKKYEKWKPNEKLSIKCKNFGGGSYMFISTNEIGHLASCQLCMT